MSGPEIDLGSDHFLRFTVWEPDDLPQNRATYNVPEGEPMPRVDPAGALIRHRAGPNGSKAPWHAGPEWCQSACTFDTIPGDPEHRWKLVSLDPLTVTPSLLCPCGDHGHITAGRWEPA